jgi:hypothetical protein
VSNLGIPRETNTLRHSIDAGKCLFVVRVLASLEDVMQAEIDYNQSSRLDNVAETKFILR